MPRRKVKDTVHTTDSEIRYCRVLYPDYEYTAAQLKALMASKKKRDLEIVYNLQWKTRSNGDDKQANIIGVYDVPQTTLNWDTFKSYLLKNSGTTGDDVKVSYMSDDGEVPVNSQRDFQIALYTFRKKARNSEVITLWLDRISEKKKKVHLVTDAQTQASGQENKAAEASQTMENGPPEWFKKYMKQFRHELMDEVREMLAPVLIHKECNVPLSTFPNVNHHHVRKSKHESKRSRQGVQLPERDLLKSLRLQNKLESKLEKIERKTLKLKEKSLAVAARSSDSDAGRSGGGGCSSSSSKSRPIGIQLEEMEMHFDAKPAKNAVTIVPHMVGGETYMQQWEVCNIGDVRWDSDTDLRFAWGHEALIPVSKTVQCPKLKPGEQGIVTVLLQVPSIPGQYESYWHFHHKGRRFGHWLGCQIIVDPSPIRSSSTDFLQSAPQLAKNDFPNPFEDHFDCKTIKREASGSPKPLNTEDVTEELKNLSLDGGEDNDLSREEKIAADDTNCSSDSDNQSIISIADTNTSVCSGSSDEFVVIPITAKDENTQEAGIIEVEKLEGRPSETSGDNNNNNNNDEENVTNNIAEIVKKEGSKSGYAYITIHGKKFAVPKCFLHDEYLATAEDAPDPSEPNATSAIPNETATTPLKPEEITTIFSKSMTETKPTFSDDFGKLTQSCTVASATDNQSSDSHCSTVGSNFSDVTKETTNNGRVFVFPAEAPGFEILSLVPDMQTSTIVADDAKEPEIESPVIQMKNERMPQLISAPDPCAAPRCYYANLIESTTPTWAYSNAHPTPCYTDIYGYNAHPYYDTNPYGPLDASSSSNNEHACHYSPKPVGAVTLTIPSAPEMISSPSTSAGTRKSSPSRVELAKPEQKTIPVQTQQLHLIPQNVMTGAVNVASSAINTAKSVLQMITPTRTEESGKWINGHWITTNPESSREAALNLLTEMGFNNQDYNASLLNRYEDDIEKVIADLLTTK